jgi:general secretion pathway protein D
MYDFANLMSNTLGLTPMLLDPAIQGSVTAVTPNSMSKDEIFSLCNLILKSKNAALIRDQGIYQIVPITSALKNNLKFIDHLPEDADLGTPGASGVAADPVTAPPREPEDPLAPRLATHVIHVEFVPVKDLLDVLNLIVTGGDIITYERQNILIVTDYADNIARIQELIRMLDKSFLDPDLVELVKIEYNAAVDVADDLKKIFGSGSGEATTSGISFLPLERMNAIFVVASTKRGLAEAKRWIKDLDSNSSQKYQTFVYAVQNSTASDIAMMITALFGGEGDYSGSERTTTSGGGGTLSGLNSRTDGSSNSSGSSNSRNSSGGMSSLFGSQSLSSSGYNQGTGSSFGSGQRLGPQINTSSQTVTSSILRGGTFSALQDVVHLINDDTNNVLYIQATPADYRYIEGTIKKMDVLPRQVRIDAQIYEVHLTDDLMYGFNGEMAARGATNLLTTSGISDSGVGSFSSFAYFGNRQITVALEAMKTKTNVKILESPSLLAKDGQQSKFQVGAEVPYIAGNSYFESGNSVANINYRDTGVIMYAIPKISASGSVTLELTLEVSSVGRATTIGSEGTTPVFQKTSVENIFSVSDGETVAIGGLIRDSDMFGRGGIPFLSDIPVIGGLFGATTKNKDRTELVILITPHVIKTTDEFQKATQELRDSLRNTHKFVDEKEAERTRDIEDARKDREKQELSNIQKIKAPKKKK